MLEKANNGTGNTGVEPLTSCEGLAAGNYPHPDCTKFYKCSPGWDPVVEMCGPGMRYNHNIVTCDWAANVPC